MRSKKEPLDGELIVQGFTGAGDLESDARMMEEKRIGRIEMAKLLRMTG